jgi:hypothetical protein
MIVAPEPVMAPAVRGGRGLRFRRHWEHVLVALGICLPVPLLAATGLAIPLPATVERLAAALVPWTETEGLDEADAVAASGAIVYAPGEKTSDVATPVSAVANPRAETPVTTPSHGTGGSADGAHANDEGGGGSSGGGSGGGSGGDPGGSDGSGGSGGTGGSTTTTGGTDPADPPSPVQDVVNDVGEATDPVVDEVEGTVTDVVGEAEDTVDGVVDGLGK